MRLSDALDGELSWTARVRLRFHLLLCGPCAATESSLRRTVEALRGMEGHPVDTAGGAGEPEVRRECD